MINNLRYIGALGAVYVACAAVGTAQAAGPDDRAEARGPGAIGAGAAVTGNTPPWLEALNRRSEALNREYGLGGHAERRQHGAPGPNWLVALNARSDAMNREYGLGDHGPTRGAGGAAKASGTTGIHADDRSGLRGSDSVALTVFSVPSAEPAEDGFALDDAALSVGATLVIAAVIGAAAVSIRYRRGMTLR